MFTLPSVTLFLPAKLTGSQDIDNLSQAHQHTSHSCLALLSAQPDEKMSLQTSV